jgi:hypothetical protein
MCVPQSTVNSNSEDSVTKQPDVMEEELQQATQDAEEDELLRDDKEDEAENQGDLFFKNYFNNYLIPLVFLNSEFIVLQSTTTTVIFRIL